MHREAFDLTETGDGPGWTQRIPRTNEDEMRCNDGGYGSSWKSPEVGAERTWNWNYGS